MSTQVPAISAGDPFLVHLSRPLAELIEPGSRLIVAVSGGADSVALLRGLGALQDPLALDLIAAHLNHALRGPESDEDARFVAELCESLDIPCEVGRVDVRGEARAGRVSVELAARRARYRFLLDVARRREATRVVVAHTADDQAETILHRILRGTGLAGLAGMPVRRRLGAVEVAGEAKTCELVRPMLGISRGEVLGFLERIGQPFRQDISNVDPAFTRNRLRTQLIPLLERDYNPRLKDVLRRLAQQAADVQAVIAELAGSVRDGAMVRRSPTEFVVDVRRLAGEHAHVQREVFRQLWAAQGWPLGEMGHGQWQRLARLLGQQESSCDLPGGVRARREGVFLYVGVAEQRRDTEPSA